MFKAYRYRIYPNQEQVKQFACHFGCARWAYNWALSQKQEYYREHGKGISLRKIQDNLVSLKKTPVKAWLREVNSQALLASIRDSETAYKNFFQKRAKFPRFKRKMDSKQSFQCPQHVTVNFIKNRITLPKIGPVKAKLHRSFQGKIKTTTISKNAAGHYYASILVETVQPTPIPTAIDPNYTLGIDLGIKSFIMTSEGSEKQSLKSLKCGLRRLKILQRRVSKKVLGSLNRAKARKRLARHHEKIKNRRLNTSHQISAELVFKNHATSFAVEDLNVSGMLKNRKLSRAIYDCAWSEFIRQLHYKSTWAGKNVLKIGRWEPSSKRCSGCGQIKETLSLNERVYHCEHCGLCIDRDHNAAINIRHFALVQNRVGGARIQACGSCNGGDGGKQKALSSSSYHGMKQEAPFKECA